MTPIEAKRKVRFVVERYSLLAYRDQTDTGLKMKGEFTRQLMINPSTPSSNRQLTAILQTRAPSATSTSLPLGLNIVVVEPHTDDAAFHVGNLMARLILAGNNVTILNPISDHLGVMETDSRTGAVIPEVTRRSIRENEGCSYAKAIGAKYIAMRMMFPFAGNAELYHDPDGSLVSWKSKFGSPQNDDFEHFARAFRALNPDWVFLPFPLDNQQMHLDTTRMTLQAIAGHEKESSGQLTKFFYWTTGSLGQIEHLFLFSQGISLLNLFGNGEHQAKLDRFKAFKSQHERARRLGRVPYIRQVETYDIINAHLAWDLLNRTPGIKQPFNYAEIFYQFDVYERD